MDLSEEKTKILHKNTIKYLHDIAEKVPNTLNVLKSYYASKFQISELQTKIRFEEGTVKTDKRCPRCCLKLKEVEPSYRVKPENKKSKFATKLSKKVDRNKNLTKYQRRYVKKNDLNRTNNLVITCTFCKNEVTFKCSKPRKQRLHVNFDPTKKRTKKKKKDKLCGLQQEAVFSAQINNNENKTIKYILSQNNKKDNVEETTKNMINGTQKRKQRVKQKKNTNKLLSMLKDDVKLNPKNNLVQFLMSLKN